MTATPTASAKPTSTATIADNAAEWANSADPAAHYYRNLAATVTEPLARSLVSSGVGLRTATDLANDMNAALLAMAAAFDRVQSAAAEVASVRNDMLATVAKAERTETPFRVVD